MPANTVSTYLTYAQLQMAAEARLDLFGNEASVAALTFGNNRSSKFSNAQAEQFASEWRVAAHQPNTNTGFSGTVFECLIDDPARGLTRGQLVMSFRSTEFIDDAARDNQATNAMEVAQGGWAMGQIADMENWFKALNQPGGALAGKTFGITGYSLGGHLATAFNLLHQGEGRITATFTFNGAGVGQVNAGESLQAIVQRFDAQRRNVDGNQIVFSDPAARSSYQELRSRLTGGVAPTDQDIEGVLHVMQSGLMDNAQGALLVAAMKRIQVIMTEAARVATLSSGSASSAPPTNVNATQVEATRLDYQLAVLVAQRSTQAFSVAGGAINTAIGSRNTLGPLGNFYDLYGAPYPSAVANSQYHYGAATPVFIEDQPLYRGTVISDAARASFEAFDVRLLVDGYSQNDFGDTHSLVLMIDSLSVQDALATLDTEVSTSLLQQIFQTASNAKAAADGSNNGQGKAEGDALENVLNSLCRIFLGASAPRLNGKLEGGTWANITDRNAFYANLKAVQDSAAYKALAGRVTLVPSAGQSSLAGDARTDFASFLSLLSLSPFVLKAKSETDAIVVEASLAPSWGNLRTEWLNDKNAVAAGKSAESITDAYLLDRQALLQWHMVRTQRNLDNNTAITGAMAGQRIAESSSYEDRRMGVQVSVGTADLANLRIQVVFGGESAEALTGYGKNDRLYGGAGNDTLSGQGGADWLEGNADADSLDGGAGADTLLGGAGDDVLLGGADNDELRGGAGSDIYRFTSGWGADTILDADGEGSIEVEGLGPINGTGAKKVAEGVWQTADKRINYTLVAIDAQRNDLFVTFSDRPDVIRIQGWSKEKKVGITLDEATTPAEPLSPLIGDFEKAVVPNTITYDRDGLNYKSSGNAAPGAADLITGTGDADTILGLGGNDALLGRGGDDSINGGDGNDVLMGGVGADTISGAAGIDIIFGSSNGTIPYLATTQDQTPTSSDPSAWYGFSWYAYAIQPQPGLFDAGRNWLSSIDRDTQDNDAGNVIDAGAGNDDVVAGTGNDIVHGGDDNDDILGMAGSDILFGDEGHDRIAGDGDHQPLSLAYTSAEDQGNDVINGGAGNDELWGQGGADELYGGSDDDMLWGDDTDPNSIHGNDYVDGGAGKDRLSGGGKSDTLIGGTGNDSLWGDGSTNEGVTGSFHAMDYLLGEDGDDEVHGGGGDDVMSGGAGDDRLWGDDDDSDRFDVSYHGKDSLDGGTGNDYLEGGAKADTLYGGADNDTLYGDGRSFPSLLYGGYGGDYLDGGFGNDALEGGGAADTLLGGAGNDWLEGDGDVVASNDQGADWLYGGDGTDILIGNGGNDTLDGGAGTDLLKGGKGSDVIIFRQGGKRDVIDNSDADSAADTIMVASGITEADLAFMRQGDTLFLGRNGSDDLLQINGYFNDERTFLLDFRNCDLLPAFVSLDNGTTWDLADIKARMAATTNADDSLVTFDTQDTLYVPGVTLYGDDGNDTLYGRDGNDMLDGGTGGDEIYAWEGDDTLVAGTGNDTLYGGTGNDVVLGQADYDTLYGEDGNDTLDGGLARVRPSYTGGQSAYMDGGNGNDVYRYGRGYGDQSLGDSGLLGSSFDTVSLGAGISPSDVTLTRAADYGLKLTIDGTDDVLRIYDQFYPIHPNSPIVQAENRVELITFADGTTWDVAVINAKVLSSTVGNDTLTGYETNDALSGGDGNDTLYGLEGADTLAGGTGSDELIGDAGADLLEGDSGNDRLLGGGDADVIHGGGGADVLGGGDGNDILDGGAGNDSLYGNNGSDIYLFDRGAGSDYIDDNSYEAAGASLNTLRLGAGVSTADLTLTRSEAQLIITVNGTADRLVVNDYFANDGQTSRTLAAIEFADGTRWDYAATLSRLSTAQPGTLVNGTSASDTLDGGLGADTLFGGAGNDTLDGGAGNDTLNGGIGNDTYVLDIGSGGDTIDSYDASAGKLDRIQLGAGIAASDVMLTRQGDALVVAINSSADSVKVQSYFATDVRYRVEQIVLADGTTWDFSTVAALLLDGGEGSIISGTAGPDTLAGGTGADRLLGGDGADILAGGIGDDRILGGNGDDAVQGGSQNDTLFGGSGADTLQGDTGDDSLTGEAGNDLLDGGAGTDVLDGGAGNDVYLFGLGHGKDTIRSLDATAGKVDEVRLGAGIATQDLIVSSRDTGGLLLSVRDTSDSLLIEGYFTGDGAAGYQVERIVFADGTVWDVATVKALALVASDENDWLQGYSGADSLAGLVGDDLVRGNGGADTLDGGHGEDQLYGGDGDDSLAGGTQHDSLYGEKGNDILRGQDGNDTLEGGAGSDLLEGGAGDDWLSQGDKTPGGNDTLDGGAGDDKLVDGYGNDIYLFGKGDGQDRIYMTNEVPSDWDVLRFDADILSSEVTVRRVVDSTISWDSYLELSIGDGSDRVRTLNFFDSEGALDAEVAIQEVQFADGTSWDVALLAAKATLIPVNGTEGPDSLVGTASPELFAGLEGNDSIVGGAGNDWLDGGVGADVLTGGAGNDTYVVDDVADVATEGVNEGSDAVTASVTWTLGDNFEKLTLTGAGAVNGTGNALDNALMGNAASNVLDGGAGADAMSGGAGDDTYVVDSVSDVVAENANAGSDTIQTSVTWTLGADVENLTLTGTSAINGNGNTLNNVLIGNSANNSLNGAAGADTMAGATGDDSYAIDSAADVIAESANEGIDTVSSSVSFTLSAHVENLTLSGTSGLSGTGNALANILTGNSGANRLDGAAGADTMAGGAGNDTYVVDNLLDVVNENAGAGTDTVESSISWTLGSALENLNLTGTSAANATGNELANTLRGNSANNVLNGGAGNDTMIGGAGDDTYKVDSTGDVVTESASQGADTVESTVTLTLSSNVENLTLVGSSAISGTGNSLANVLTGNSAANALTGGAGDDTYVVGAGDTVVEAASAGTDTVQSSITSTLASNVENLVLTGSGAINGTGNTLNNVLTGNSAANTLTGGTGNDTYVVGAGDTVVEAASAGTDTVQASVSWTLASNVENLTLTGGNAINGTGNSLNNVLIGNSAVNVLTGGTGNDTYVVGQGDTVMEAASAGTDTVQSSSSWTLGSNLEHLTLTGSSSINATGNTVANTLTGNSASNVLTGNAGNDTLDGVGGTDTLIGGTGADLYRFGSGYGIDTVQENDTTTGVKDAVVFAGTVNQADVQFQRAGNNLEMLMRATSDKLVVKDWYVASQYRVEEFRFANGTLLDTQVQSLAATTTASAASLSSSRAALTVASAETASSSETGAVGGRQGTMSVLEAFRRARTGEMKGESPQSRLISVVVAAMQAKRSAELSPDQPPLRHDMFIDPASPAALVSAMAAFDVSTALSSATSTRSVHDHMMSGSLVAPSVV